MADKTRHDRLTETTAEELIGELVRRRRESLRDCSDQEIEDELERRGVDRSYQHPKDEPPRYVEK